MAGTSEAISIDRINRTAMPEMRIFLLMGQSNMAGRGPLEEVEPIRDHRIRVFDGAQWHEAVEPLHHDKASAGVGLAMSFGQALLRQQPDARIGFVPCAVGSTPIARWLPGADLYGKAMNAALEAKRTSPVAGVLWHQGEHDAQDEANARNYSQNLARMIAGLRNSLHDPRLPVVVGGLGNFLSTRTDFPFFQIVHASLEKLPGTVPCCAFASSAGLRDKGDALHFDANSLREFGRRYATAYLDMLPCESTPANR